MVIGCRARHTELSATRRDSRGELGMVVVIESYDSQESRSCGSSFPRDSRPKGCAFGSFKQPSSMWLACKIEVPFAYKFQ